MTLRIMLSAVIAAGMAIPVAAQTQAQDRTAARVAAMDTNHDGIVTRAEWRGTEQTFRERDWNNDGVLSGDELQPGAQRGPAARPAQFDAATGQGLTDWTAERFVNLDHNRDGRLTRDEWHFDQESFARADHNRDGVVSRAEFLGTDAAPVGTSGDRFDDLDLNHDGCLTRDEFDRATGSPSQQTAARKAGYDRGLIEGRAAGREDKERNQGWDLEGQRELESADSGYQPRMGSHAEYQGGYREGFRRGYREGWNQK